MKFLTKIQSISDIITNSSSETFLMNKQSADYFASLPNTNDCISIQPVTAEWMKENPWESDLICNYLGIYDEDTREYVENCTYSDWREFVDEVLINRDDVNFDNLYYVEIEDHFEDAYEVLYEARHSCYKSESHH